MGLKIVLKSVLIKVMGSSTRSSYGCQIIKSYEATALKKRSLGVRFADHLTAFFGSIWFLIFNFITFAGWILINIGKVPGVAIFDPFPFILLVTFVSLEAIILTTVVLMSQTRQSLISSLREEMDMQVNLISEREITKSLILLKNLLDEKGIKIEDAELEEMIKQIDTSYIERALERQLMEKPPSFVREVAKGVTRPIVKVGEKVGQEVGRSFNPTKK